MRENSIPICRSIQGHWIYKDAEYFKVWFEMLANARYGAEPKTDIWQGIIYTLNRGEFIFGRKSWSERLNVGEQKIRTLIKKLIKEEMLKEVLKTSKFTIYLITNYENFNPLDNRQDNRQQNEENQGFEQYDNHQDNRQDNRQITDRQPPSNHQVTTKEERKEGSKKENKVNIYSENSLLDEAIKDFIAMRKTIKKPISDKGISLMLGKLKKISNDESVQIEILNQSIMNSWQGVFSLKDDRITSNFDKKAQSKPQNNFDFGGL